MQGAEALSARRAPSWSSSATRTTRGWKANWLRARDSAPGASGGAEQCARRRSTSGWRRPPSGALEPAAEAFGKAADPRSAELRGPGGARGARYPSWGVRSRPGRHTGRRSPTAPGLPAALVGLGRLELEAGRPEGAVASFEAALASDPGHRQALYNLAAALSLLGRTDEAADRSAPVRGSRCGRRRSRGARSRGPGRGRGRADASRSASGSRRCSPRRRRRARTSSSWTEPRKPESASTTRTAGAAGAT